MPRVLPNNDHWLAGQIAELKREVAALKSSRTTFITDTNGNAQAIIGNVATDPNGNATGLSGWGIAVLKGAVWGLLSQGNVAYGVATTPNSGATTASVTVTHGLGRKPVIALAVLDLANPALVAWTGTYTAATFVIESSTTGANITATGKVYWLAIG